LKPSRLGLTLTAVVALAVSSVVVWDTAQADPGTPVRIAGTPSVDPNRVGASIAYLRSQYGVSEKEAVRRLALQIEAEQIDDQLRKNEPDSYGGMWLDQSSGVLRIAMTNPGAVRSAVAKLPDAAHISVKQVGRSLKQLDAVAASVSAQTGPIDAQVAVDVTTNQVAVYQAAGAAAAGKSARTTDALDTAQKNVAKPDHRIAAIVAAHPGAVLRQLVIGQAKSATLAAAPASCDPVTCPPPLRAGSRLVIKRTTANTDSDNESTTYGECTLGFVVYDVARRQYYALTAGHCVAGPDKKGINRAYDSNLREIGPEVPDYMHGSDAGSSTYPTDYALIAIPDYAHWFGADPKNQIDVFCTTVQPTGCTDASIAVIGVRSYPNGVGAVVCATGSGADDNYGYKSSQLDPGTRCGEITNTNGGYVANICSRKGDSGGPLFSQATGRAYGILNDGTAGTDVCKSGEWSQYSPVSLILSKINAQALNHQGGVGQFVVRTAP
jgi:streptogrisin C